LLAHFEAVAAHCALLRLGFNLIALENRRAIRTNLIAYSAPITLLAVYQHRTIFRLLVDSLARTISDTGWFFAVVAGNPLKMNTYIGEAAFFIFIDPQVLERSWRECIPILTSDGAGVAT
jgi:hypothetical protein